jgi:hypothetical protein
MPRVTRFKRRTQRIFVCGASLGGHRTLQAVNAAGELIQQSQWLNIVGSHWDFKGEVLG